MFSITNAASIKPQQKNIGSTVGKMLLLPLSCLWACWKAKRNQKVISLWGKKNKSGYYWSFSCLHVFDIYVWKGFQNTVVICWFHVHLIDLIWMIAKILSSLFLFYGYYNNIITINYRIYPCVMHSFFPQKRLRKGYTWNPLFKTCILH